MLSALRMMASSRGFVGAWEGATFAHAPNGMIAKADGQWTSVQSDRRQEDKSI